MAAASMPMYDLPEAEAAFDALWAGFRRHFARQGLDGAPRHLLHGRPLAALWADPALWFSECCGYDLIHGYADVLRPVATPHRDAPGCVGRGYVSFVVVAEENRAEDLAALRGAICAINGPESHSGMNALRALVAPLARDGRFFGEIKVSGRHVDSLAMVRQGTADVAAIDCVSYAMLARYRAQTLAGIRVIGQTESAPGIPYVTRIETGDETVERLRAGILAAFADPELAEARQALFLKDVEPTDAADYAPVAEVRAYAARLGYPELR